jgi:hypothetical protein
MFSTNPFVTQEMGKFSFIRPNKEMAISLPKDEKTISIDIPDEFKNANAVVQVKAGSISKSLPYYSNSLVVHLIENYGQLKVILTEAQKPLSSAYVKVYSKGHDGKVAFYKDGYTDIRGRFDYASLSTDDLDKVAKFSILVCSEKYGSVIKEANPPRV